jgi:branched-chain amino acid transport system ATP-binding protein
VSEFAAVLESAAQRSTVLLVEQNLSVVKRLAQRIIVLDHGEVVHEGEADDLKDELLVRRLLGVAGAA